jgi:hypothetical protein
MKPRAMKTPAKKMMRGGAMKKPTAMKRGGAAKKMMRGGMAKKMMRGGMAKKMMRGGMAKKK